MRRIVVGYDGTDTASRAVDEAATLATATGAELHVVTVVDDERVRSGMDTTELHERAVERAAAMTELLLSSGESGLAHRLADVATFTSVVSGPAAGRLVEYAREIDADLIVVGNRRVQGIERVLGSVAVAVLRQTPCSVYVAATV